MALAGMSAPTQPAAEPGGRGASSAPGASGWAGAGRALVVIAVVAVLLAGWLTWRAQGGAVSASVVSAGAPLAGAPSPSIAAPAAARRPSSWSRSWARSGDPAWYACPPVPGSGTPSRRPAVFGPAGPRGCSTWPGGLSTASRSPWGSRLPPRRPRRRGRRAGPRRVAAARPARPELRRPDGARDVARSRTRHGTGDPALAQRARPVRHRRPAARGRRHRTQDVRPARPARAGRRSTVTAPDPARGAAPGSAVLVVAALATWAATAAGLVGTALDRPGLVLTAAGSLAAATASAAWRGPALRTAAVPVVLVACCGAVIAVTRVAPLVSGPFPAAAADRAFVSAVVTLSGDPVARDGDVQGSYRTQTPSSRPPRSPRGPGPGVPPPASCRSAWRGCRPVRCPHPAPSLQVSGRLGPGEPLRRSAAYLAADAVSVRVDAPALQQAAQLLRDVVAAQRLRGRG